MIDIAFYDEDMNRQVLENVVIDSQEITEIPEAMYRGLGNVKFIVPNEGGHAYVKIRLDEWSQKNILATAPSAITNKIDRMLLSTNLKHSVDNFELSSLDLFNWVVEGFGQDTNEFILQK